MSECVSAQDSDADGSPQQPLGVQYCPKGAMSSAARRQLDWGWEAPCDGATSARPEPWPPSDPGVQAAAGLCMAIALVSPQGASSPPNLQPWGGGMEQGESCDRGAGRLEGTELCGIVPIGCKLEQPRGMPR